MELRKKRWAWHILARADAALNRWYGSRFNPLYQSGAIAVTLLVVLLVTGLYLLIFYRLGQPWASVQRITGQVWAGRWIRGLHRFASDAAVVAVGVHAFRMYAQRRDWGPRALAWVSGLILLFVLYVCGWTGYVMVWDGQAQVLAAEGARLLDVLPIFSEPISRTFVGESTLPNAFFFLNLFAHVALPIGAGLLLWIHVSRVARPALLPPRGLLWGVVLALLALAVIWPVQMAPRAQLLRIPEHVTLDLFYAFWLPISRGFASSSVWAFGSGVALCLLLLPLWSRPARAARPEKSVVNERHCTGCEQCMLDCPYGAISMVPRPDGREGIVARVNPDHCVACGICVASCAPMALGPASQTGRDQLNAARAWLAERRIGRRDVVVIGCAWSGMQPGPNTFEVPCAGNLHTTTVEVMSRAAGGVLIASCHERDCRGREGVKWLHERLYHGREAELKERVDRTRIRVLHVAQAERGVYEAELAAFQQETALRAAPELDDVDVIALCERAARKVTT